MPSPAHDPALTANLVCRIIFAILGNTLCVVPLRLLIRNSDFAAPVFITATVIMNFLTILNSLLWRSDDLENWYNGVGLCDIEAYITLPMQTIYAASLFEIMRHLANQVALVRTQPANCQDRKKKHLAQAVIIFPVAVLQLALTYVVQGQRYIIGTLVGCVGVYDNSWPKLIIIVLPPTLYAIATAPYAYLTWKRYREISRSTQQALASSGGAIAQRANRTRRRLYQMSMSILVPYLPLQLVFFGFNMKVLAPNGLLSPYDFYQLHHPDTSQKNQYPWNSVLFLPSWHVDFVTMNQPWIAIFTTIPIFLFFGLTHDAKQTYRRYALVVGLDKCFPGLIYRHTDDSGIGNSSRPLTKSIEMR